MIRLLLVVAIALALLAGVLCWTERPGEPALSIAPRTITPNPELTEGSTAVVRLRAVNTSGRPISVLSVITC